MKFEFALDVKGVPTANVHVALECSAEELVTLISDPVYQGLGQKFINEVSFAPKAPKAEANVNSNAVVEELCSKVRSILNGFRKEMDTEKKVRETERKINDMIAERTQKF